MPPSRAATGSPDFPKGTLFILNISHIEKQNSYWANPVIFTKYHHFDCTSNIHIGKFTTIAGYHSQFLTHSIDLYENRQDSNSILIGDYPL